MNTMRDLIERLETTSRLLDAAHTELLRQGTYANALRVRDEATGVRLALSYVREYEQEGQSDA